ncbi:hypothetical protein M2283_008798 [Streptomyces pseudovenezuelae]|uniref:Uncharacterized protein n=1 Tax=Streptomyces pseudovenezuelae TaxID=67350 RepID=A0ABT6LYS0_9ACTN|nr:hypothetical protein [Streptomyces pseudovenezuelae]
MAAGPIELVPNFSRIRSAVDSATRRACGIEAEPFGNLAVDQVLAAQRERGQPAPLKARGVHHLVGEQTQIVLVRGRLGQAARLLPLRSTDERQHERESTRGLPPAAQFYTELHDQTEQGRTRGGAVECGGGRGHRAGGDRHASALLLIRPHAVLCAPLRKFLTGRIDTLRRAHVAPGCRCCASRRRRASVRRPESPGHVRCGASPPSEHSSMSTQPGSQRRKATRNPVMHSP